MVRGGEVKREVIQFRATPEEAAVVRSKARNANITVAQFVRDCVLGIPFSIVDLELLDLLRRLGALLKFQVGHDYNTSGVEKTLVAFQKLSEAVVNCISRFQQRKSLTEAERSNILAGIDEAFMNGLEPLASGEYGDVDCKIR